MNTLDYYHGHAPQPYDPKFLKYFARLIGSEGGFTADPKDPGNWTSGRAGVGQCLGTKYGIAANTYGFLPIESLTLEDAKAIYWLDWWMKIGADKLPDAVAYQVWQFAVNAGMGTAKRGLQHAVGVAEDGQVGAMTLAAVATTSLNDILLRFNAFALRHYASLSTFERYGVGWSRRVADNLDFAAGDN